MDTILYNAGEQPISHLPLDRDARVVRVESATYRIVDLRRSQDSPERIVQDTAPATVDPASTTLTVAAGPQTANPRLLSVANAAEFRAGHHFLIEEHGFTHGVVIDEVDVTNQRIHLSHELSRPFGVGALVRGVELMGTFPAITADDEDHVRGGGGPFASIWMYTHGGQVWIRDHIHFVTRYSVAPILTEQEVIDAWPTLATRLGHRATVRQALRVAMQDFVGEVEASGKNPHYFRPSTAAKLAVRFKTIAYCLMWAGQPRDLEIAADLEKKYQRLLNNLVVGVPDHGTVNIDPSTDTAPAGSEQLAGNAYFSRS